MDTPRSSAFRALFSAFPSIVNPSQRSTGTISFSCRFALRFKCCCGMKYAVHGNAASSLPQHIHGAFSSIQRNCAQPYRGGHHRHIFLRTVSKLPRNQICSSSNYQLSLLFCTAVVWKRRIRIRDSSCCSSGVCLRHNSAARFPYKDWYKGINRLQRAHSFRKGVFVFRMMIFSSTCLMHALTRLRAISQASARCPSKGLSESRVKHVLFVLPLKGNTVVCDSESRC